MKLIIFVREEIKSNLSLQNGKEELFIKNYGENFLCIKK